MCCLQFMYKVWYLEQILLPLLTMLKASMWPTSFLKKQGKNEDSTRQCNKFVQKISACTKPFKPVYLELNENTDKHFQFNFSYMLAEYINYILLRWNIYNLNKNFMHFWMSICFDLMLYMIFLPKPLVYHNILQHNWTKQKLYISTNASRILTLMLKLLNLYILLHK